MVSSSSDIEIARQKDVIITRAEHRQAPPEHRAELKTGRDVLGTGQRVESGLPFEGDVANAPQHVGARNSMTCVPIAQRRVRVVREASRTDDDGSRRGGIFITRQRPAKQRETARRTDPNHSPESDKATAAANPAIQTVDNA